MDLVKRSPERLLYLDSARGIAAFSVMISHFLLAFTLTEGSIRMANHGWQALVYGEGDILFFFLHSGFILSYAIDNRGYDTRLSAYFRFLIERIFRIYPLFIFIVLLSFLLKETVFPIGTPAFTSAHLRAFWTRIANLKTLLNELALINSVDQEGNRRLIPQEWTAAVEILIGAIIPILWYCLKKTKMIFVYWLIVLLAIKLAGFNMFLFDFALGVFLYCEKEKIKEVWSRMRRWQKYGVLLLSTGCFSCAFQFPSLFNFDKVFIRPGVDHAIVSGGCALFFCMLIGSRRIQTILSHSIFVMLGRICYSLYLVHMMVLICFGDWVVRLLSYHSGMPLGLCVFVFFLVYASATVLFSRLSFALVEKPFNMLGKRLAAAIERQIATAEKIIFKKQLMRKPHRIDE